MQQLKLAAGELQHCSKNCLSCRWARRWSADCKRSLAWPRATSLAHGIARQRLVFGQLCVDLQGEDHLAKALFTVFCLATEPGIPAELNCLSLCRTLTPSGSGEALQYVTVFRALPASGMRARGSCRCQKLPLTWSRGRSGMAGHRVPEPPADGQRPQGRRGQPFRFGSFRVLSGPRLCLGRPALGALQPGPWGSHKACGRGLAIGVSPGCQRFDFSGWSRLSFVRNPWES